MTKSLILPKLFIIRLLLVGSEDNVGVSSVELAIMLSWPGLDLELFNSPDLKSNLLASIGPGRLSFSCCKLNLFIIRNRKGGQKEVN